MRRASGQWWHGWRRPAIVSQRSQFQIRQCRNDVAILAVHRAIARSGRGDASRARRGNVQNAVANRHRRRRGKRLIAVVVDRCAVIGPKYRRVGHEGAVLHGKRPAGEGHGPGKRCIIPREKAVRDRQAAETVDGAAVVRNVALERAAFDVQCADVGDGAAQTVVGCRVLGIIADKEAVIHGQRSVVVQDRCALARQRRLPGGVVREDHVIHGQRCPDVVYGPAVRRHQPGGHYCVVRIGQSQPGNRHRRRGRAGHIELLIPARDGQCIRARAHDVGAGRDNGQHEIQHVGALH